MLWSLFTAWVSLSVSSTAVAGVVFHFADPRREAEG